MSGGNKRTTVPIWNTSKSYKILDVIGGHGGALVGKRFDPTSIFPLDDKPGWVTAKGFVQGGAFVNFLGGVQLEEIK